MPLRLLLRLHCFAFFSEEIKGHSLTFVPVSVELFPPSGIMNHLQQQQLAQQLAQQQQVQGNVQMTPQQYQMYQLQQQALQQQALQQQALQAQQQQLMNANPALLNDQSQRLNVDSQIELWDHQKAMLFRMAEIEWQNQNSTVSTIAVMNDEPGVGKSFPLLALILREKERTGQTQNLLVLPENLVSQWVESIKAFSKTLTFGLLNTYSVVSQLYNDMRPLILADICITTSIYYNVIQQIMTSRKNWFNRVILDEADSLSFFLEHPIPSKNIWLVSASVDQLNTGAYARFKSSNVVKCDPKFVLRSIKLPPIDEHVHVCVEPYVELMRGVIGRLAGLNAHDYTGLKFPNLRGENVHNAKEAFSAVFRDWSAELGNIVENLPKLQDAMQNNPLDLSVQETYKETMLKKEALVSRLKIIYDKVDRKLCAICVEPLTFEQVPMTSPCCVATFCTACWATHLGRFGKCIKCFRPLQESQLVKGSVTNDADVLVQGKNKIEIFEEVFEVEKNRPDFRGLFFSDFSGSLKHIFPIFERAGLKFAEIEGSSKSIDKAIEDYKTGRKPILVISSQSFGAGMNLEMTTSLFLFHKSDRRQQVIGRAQRFGRRNNLHLHEFFYPNEMERRV